MDLSEIVIPLFVALVVQVIASLLIKMFGKGGNGVLGEFRTAMGKTLPLPFSLTIWVVALSISIQSASLEQVFNISFSIPVGEKTYGIAEIISLKRVAFVILMITWFISRLIRTFSSMIETWQTNSDFDPTAIQALSSIGVVLTWAVGSIVIMQSIGMNMSAIITIGGIGGAAFAFASKDVISNFFGGLLIMFNRPFGVGDTIESGSKINGKVTKIGLYATWLETDDGNSMYVPNAIFNSSEIKKSIEDNESECS